ncbi:MAG: hypothetical protein NT169_05300 [Chloroflexi bacterium]|nr:hypothetical protein [Chloroflexota bacterium]
MPPPTATIGPRPAALANTRWELDHILANGEKQPAYHPGQCLRFGAITEYVYFNGCNVGHCTDTWRWTPPPPQEKFTVLCTETVMACQETDPQTGNRTRVSWDQPFSDAIGKYAWSELRDGSLWWHTSLDGNVVLVFCPLITLCEGESGWLPPIN